MKKITGQVIYVGPNIPSLALTRGTIFRDGIFDALYPWISKCPALGELFLPPERVAEVNKELNVDEGRQMRGTKGKYVVLYNSVQNWLSATTNPQPGVKIESHA